MTTAVISPKRSRHPTFDGIVEDSVREALTKVLGDPVWRSVSFYFDTKTCARDPEGFARVLDRLFGPGSKALRKVIADTLLRKTGVQATNVAPGQDRDFRYWIQLAKTRFLSTTSGFPTSLSQIQ